MRRGPGVSRPPACLPLPARPSIGALTGDYLEYPTAEGDAAMLLLYLARCVLALVLEGQGREARPYSPFPFDCSGLPQCDVRRAMCSPSPKRPRLSVSCLPMCLPGLLSPAQVPHPGGPAGDAGHAPLRAVRLFGCVGRPRLRPGRPRVSVPAVSCRRALSPVCGTPGILMCLTDPSRPACSAHTPSAARRTSQTLPTSSGCTSTVRCAAWWLWRWSSRGRWTPPAVGVSLFGWK